MRRRVRTNFLSLFEHCLTLTKLPNTGARNKSSSTENGGVELSSVGVSSQSKKSGVVDVDDGA